MIRLALKLVGFTAVCLAFTAWLAFTIGNIDPFADRYSLSATFDDVTGLLENDNVKVAGVVVGKVTGIGVEDGKAVVDFEVDDSVDLPSDTETAVRWRNLLGQRYVYLFPGDAGTTLEGGDHIPLDRSRPIVDLGELFNRLGPVLQSIDPEQVNNFLLAFTGALEEGNDELLGATISDLGTFAEALGSRDEAIGRMVSNLASVTDALVARDEQLRTILDNVTDLAATFNENTDVVERTVVDLGGFSEALGKLLAQNRPGIDRILTRVGEVVDVVDDRFDELETTVVNLDDLSLALYNASRYGEWLNQWIPCSVIDVDGPEGPIPPFDGSASCTSQTTGDGEAAARTPPNELAEILGAVTGAADPGAGD